MKANINALKVIKDFVFIYYVKLFRFISFSLKSYQNLPVIQQTKNPTNVGLFVIDRVILFQ